jgi:hypothetical protein
MKPQTRRTVTKLLLAAPAALAAVPLGCQSTGSSSSGSQHLTPEQRQQREDLSKSVSRLRESVQRVGQMQIPVGSEPAIYFSPLVSRPQ